MQPMTSQRWTYTNAYLRTVFGGQDEQLRTLMERAVAAGIPDISVAPEVGHAIKLLASMTNGGRGAKLALELGTLAGYSGIWLARGLAPDGRLVTVEPEAKHADFARQEFDRAGVGAKVEIRRALGLEVLAQLAQEQGPECLDVVFIDAVKIEYPEYFRLARPLIARGGLFMVDNTLGSNSWWIDEPAGTNRDRDAVDRMSRMVAGDGEFEATCLANGGGLLVARKLG